MARLIISNIREEEQHRVLTLLDGMREVASMPIQTRAVLAAMLLLPPHELRGEIREVLDLAGKREVAR